MLLTRLLMNSHFPGLRRSVSVALRIQSSHGLPSLFICSEDIAIHFKNPGSPYSIDVAIPTQGFGILILSKSSVKKSRDGSRTIKLCPSDRMRYKFLKDIELWKSLVLLEETSVSFSELRTRAAH